MAPVAQRRRLDDEDLSDFDPAFFPRRVYKDGRGPTVRLMLTDAAPSALGRRSRAGEALNDAHRPHQIVASDSAEMRAALADAEAAYAERSARLENAWRGPSNPPPPEDDGDAEDAEAARAAYKDRLSNAWRQRSPPSSLPPGNPFTTPPPRGGDGPDAIRAAQARTAGGGGVFPRPGGAATDADPDAEYRAYCDRISNGWRR
jgi:hypothetical protein